MKLTEYLNSIDIDKPIKSITGGLIIEKTEITQIDLSELQSIGKYISIYNNTQLTQIDLPKLQLVGKNLYIDGNPQLKILNNQDYENEIQIKQALQNQVGK